jgi:tRNA threonylcarbamoyladenosine biosynthesis protein TsaB
LLNILAIETSTQACSAALLCDAQVSQRYQVAPRGHGDLILGMIDQLLREADLTPTRLTAVAFGRGPGAFTGVRVAASVAQGIAYAADLPVVPVSTLAALALAGYRHNAYQAVLCATDARMGEVYWGAYQVQQGVVSLLGDECVCRPEAVPVPGPGEWYGVGNGWAVYAGQLPDVLTHVPVAEMTEWLPRAEEVALLAKHEFEQGRTVAADQAVPVYLRDNVAQKKQNYKSLS